MGPLLKSILKIFDDLPPVYKLIVLVLLIVGLIIVSIYAVLKRRAVKDLTKENERLRLALDTAEAEKEKLQDQIDKLNEVDVHVWRRPDKGDHRQQFISPEERKTKTRFVSFFNLKGGVGKTTLTVNIGAGLALQGNKVLMVDLDFQGTMSALMLSNHLLGEYREKGWTTNTLLKTETESQSARQVCFSSSHVNNCAVIIADESLAELEFAQQARFHVDEEHDARFCFLKLFHSEHFLEDFDFVLFDCPPRLTTSCINALICSDYVLTPTSLSQSDIEAVPRSLRWLRVLQHLITADFLGAIICGCSPRSGQLNSHEERQREQLNHIINEHLPGRDHVFEHWVARKSAVERAASKRTPLIVASPNEGRTLFDPVVAEFLKRMHL